MPGGTVKSHEADGRTWQLQGVGTFPGRNQLGESWPDNWFFERDRSYGFTLKLGGSPESCGQRRRATTRSQASPSRRGLRLASKAAWIPVRAHFGGDPDFISGTDSRDLDCRVGPRASAWRRCWDNRSRSTPKSYTRYAGEEWVTPFNEGGSRSRLHWERVRRPVVETGAVFLRVKETTGLLTGV